MKRKKLDNVIWLVKLLSVAIMIVVVTCEYFKDAGYFNYLIGYIGAFFVVSWLVSSWWALWFHYRIYRLVFKSYISDKGISIKSMMECIKEYISNEFFCKIGEESKGGCKKNKFDYWLNIIKHSVCAIVSPDYLSAKIFKYSLENDNSYNRECPNRNKIKNKVVVKGKEIIKLKIHQVKDTHVYLNTNVKCEYNSKEYRYDCERHQEKKRLQRFVIYSNWTNVAIACLLLIVSWFIHIGVGDDAKNKLIKFAFIFVIVRLISRSIEIAFAFYCDVVRTKMTRDLSIGERSTNLKRGHRISLVVHSYFEFVILFSILYFLEPIWINGDVLSGMKNYIDFILYSASVSAFNISFDTNKLTILGKIIHTSQVFLSINLIVLSIATYLGFQDKMNDFEKADWREENPKK
ncbi:hypothetical protein [Bacillus cereus]|uniref:hypothetical protein n=1 Tax=Bacillus cereus TaxID=1396 RepID=UPI000D11F160|nr:hypothetical protein [Bacillus cereus]AVR33499.1 hypothetical protein FORC60_3675 [Bacillus cereus]